jgi:hypothetical protein
MLTQLAEWARLGFIQRTGAGTYALDTTPPNWPPGNLTVRSPGAISAPDGDEERGKVQRPQRSEDERTPAVTSGVHHPGAPGNDTPTPTTSWTSSPHR